MHKDAPLDRQIAEAKQRVAELEERQLARNGSWPKRCTIFLHSDKESNYETGEELGLEGEALALFMYTAYEVKLEYEVDAKGGTHLLNVDGHELKDSSPCSNA